MSRNASHGIGPLRSVIGVTSCLLVLLAGCAAPAAAPAASTPAATGGPSPGASEVTQGSDTPAPEWRTFTTPDGTLSFDYPAEWTIAGPAADSASGGVSVQVKSANGKLVATLRTHLVVGAECTDKFPYMTYDSEPVPALAQGGVTPRFVYEGRSNPAAVDPMKTDTFAYGITSGPVPAGETACPIAHFFTWPPSGAAFGGAYNPFDTTPGNQLGVDTPEAYADTAEYQFIRQMITSLRPAGK